MNKITSLFVCLLLTGLLYAQPEKDFEDLLLPFVDAKYEKVLYKAEKYTLEDETKKEPLPYLFMSMSYFNISRMEDEKMKTKFPDAAKNAIKSLTKYAKLDKEKKYAEEYADFFKDIRQTIISEAETFNDQNKFTKAKANYASLEQIDANDAGAKVMLALTFERMKSKKEAEMKYAEAKKLLSEKTATVSNETQKNFLKNSIIALVNNMVSKNEKSAAKEWMDLGMEWFGEDNEYKVTYESL
jgi:tetratricopeptide (TPR) repeat protein